MLAAVVIILVVLAILNEPVGDSSFQAFDICRSGVPIDKKRFDLRPQKMVRARSAEFCQPRPVDAVYESQHLRIVLDGADKTTVHRNLTADERNDLRLKLLTGLVIEVLVFRPAECGVTFVFRFNKLSGTVDDLERGFVAG